MSKYIEQSKVNDEIVRVLEHTDCKDEYIDRVLMAIEHLPTIEVSEECISREEMLDTYAELYDVFDDYPNIIEELHKVYDKINDIPTVEPNSSEKPNNSTISKMEQVDEPQTERSE